MKLNFLATFFEKLVLLGGKTFHEVHDDSKNDDSKNSKIYMKKLTTGRYLDTRTSTKKRRHSLFAFYVFGDLDKKKVTKMSSELVIVQS